MAGILVGIPPARAHRRQGTLRSTGCRPAREHPGICAVQTTRFGTWTNVTYRRQRAISIDARPPFDTGWMYVDDGNPATPPCRLLGQVEYQAPRIRVAETKFLVRVAAFAQKTPGDTTGCVLGPDDGVRPCPNLTRTIVKLKHELGSRQLRFEVVPG